MSRARSVLREGRDCASALSNASLLVRFIGQRDGNIAMLFTFMLAVLMLFTGGAVDYTRYNAVRTDLIESMDAAGLAIAQIDALNGPEIKDLSGDAREAYLIEQGRKFFAENFQHADVVNDLFVDFEITAATITPRATGYIKTLFLHIGESLLDKIAGTGTGYLVNLDLTTDTEITRRGSGRIEVALVLDVTGSMSSKANSSDSYTKIESLRIAVDNLLQVMFGDNTTDDNLKVAVVPFNAYVNAGGASSWDGSWGDENADSYYHGAHFIHVDATGTVDTSATANAVNSTGVAKVMDVNRKVNHYDLYNSHSSLNWKGCVEARPFPLDELDTPPGDAAASSDVTAATSVPTELSSPANSYDQRTKDAFERAPTPALTTTQLTSIANSRFVPLFHPDEPDCASSTCKWSGGATMSYTLGSVTRDITVQGYMFDDPDDVSGVSESAYGNRSFIADGNYAKSNSSNNSTERFPRYADVMLGFRIAASNSYSTLDSYWDGVKAKLESMGMPTGTGGAGLYEFILRNAYVGWWDAATSKYLGKYDTSPSIDESVSDSDSSTRGPNQACNAPILPLTNDRELVETHMDTLFPHGNTDSANGAAWGVRALSPEAPFTEGVEYDDPDWSKAIVLMTDGVNVASTDSTHWKSAHTSYGFAIEERMGVGVDLGGRGGSGFDADRMADQIDEKLLRVCHRAKQKGILVYAVIFGLDDAGTEQIFRACATKPTAPYYYKAPTAAQLEAAFSGIAQDLVKLHVSK